MIVSGGPNYNIQIDNQTAERNTIRIYAPGTRDVDDYNDSPAGIRPEEFDDLVKWVTLDELRVKMGCPGAQLRIITTELPMAYQGQSYSAEIRIEGGIPNYNYTFPYVSMPPGITLNPLLVTNNTNYTITGTPQCPGNYSFTLNVTDSENNNATRTFTLNVQPRLLYLNPMPGTTFYVQNGTSFSRTITASGGYPHYIANCTPANKL